MPGATNDSITSGNIVTTNAKRRASDPSDHSPDSTQQYRAWLVVLDGTMYRAPFVKLAMATELLLGHWRAIPVLRKFRRVHETLRKELNEPVDDPYHLQLVRTAQMVDQHVEKVEQLVTEWMIKRPRKWLRLFRRRRLSTKIEQHRRNGGKTALVSDYPADDKLFALRATELFDVVIANGQAGGPLVGMCGRLF